MKYHTITFVPGAELREYYESQISLLADTGMPRRFIAEMNGAPIPRPVR